MTSRNRRIRMSDQEVANLQAVRESCEQFDSTQPVGFIAGKLAEQMLAEQFSEEIGVPA